jgi:hypothetical protein
LWARSRHITTNFRIYRIRSILEFVVICPNGPQITSFLITYWGAIPKKNIFPGAHDAVWGAFPWHDGAASPHSSQALAVSVFGTLAFHRARQVLIDAMLFSTFGCESAGDDPWRVDLERTLGRSLLGERQSTTQVDVLLHNQTSVVMLECKFTEAGGGPCSQPKPLSSGPHRGLRQCDGTYREQTNPVNGKRPAVPCRQKASAIGSISRLILTWSPIKTTSHAPSPGLPTNICATCWPLASGPGGTRRSGAPLAWCTWLAMASPYPSKWPIQGANGTNSSRACVRTRRWWSGLSLTRLSCKSGTNACQGMRCWQILLLGLRKRSKTLAKQSEDVVEEVLDDPIKPDPDDRISRLDPG